MNLTNLIGTMGDDGIIRFTGKAANEVTVNVQMTLEEGLAHLKGQTTPPPGSADFFILNLDAQAQRMY